MADPRAGNGGQDDRWTGEVEFWDRDALAYVPGEILVPKASRTVAEDVISRRQPSRSREGTSRDLGDDRDGFTQLVQVDDPLGVVEELRRQGILAQPNHVVFSHCLCCGCGPHPASYGPYGWVSANPFAANPFAANPFAANPFAANPFAANPFAANPFAANPFAANPFAANPFAANPYGWDTDPDRDASPSPVRLLASGGARPETDAFRATGLRTHSAHEARAPHLPGAPALPGRTKRTPGIMVIDTGIAMGDFSPAALTGVVRPFDTPRDVFPPPPGNVTPPTFKAEEVPDEDGDHHLDPVAGHGTFIAGLIDGIAPGSQLEVHGLLTPKGVANEVDLAATLDLITSRPDGTRPALVNLSFGGYTAVDMGRLAEAVRELQKTGTVVVASAGNDATCRPSFPAALPGVVAVGALGPHGPAHFTNYGPWVRACAPGVDVVSTFFREFAPAPVDEDLKEWVRWSGTSFAAPAVVGALARAMRDGIPTAQEAVERVIDDTGLFRIPGLGTVVNQTPLFVRT